MLMEEILGFAGYHCVAVANVKEALAAYDRACLDIILTDISMPAVDSFEEIAYLRGYPGGAVLPIVAVTAHAMSGDREFLLREGCDAYLAKPHRPQHLLAVVERLVNA